MNNPENISNQPTENNLAEKWQNMAGSLASGENRETTKEIKVRLLDPEKDNLNQAANLVYQVDPYICPDFFGDSERAEKMGPTLFGEGSLFDPNHTIVAEEDGKLLINYVVRVAVSADIFQGNFKQQLF